MKDVFVKDTYTRANMQLHTLFTKYLKEAIADTISTKGLPSIDKATDMADVHSSHIYSNTKT